ncbi:MAG: thiamine phosphate synthase [Blastocatellia bacterium]
MRGPELRFLVEFVARAFSAGVDLVQIRERDLSARDLFYLTHEVTGLAHSAGAAKVLVNDRVDVARSAGSGVHLTTHSLTAEAVREAFGAEILIGVSTHSLDEAETAERGGADFVVFGPIFETASKKTLGNPVGVEPLRQVAGSLKIPVLALGGIKPANVPEVLDAGASGVAGISMFTDNQDLNSLVAAIKDH